MDLSSIEQIIRTQVPNAPDSDVELYLDSVQRDMKFGGDYSDMSEDDIVEDFEFYIQSRMDEAQKPSMKMKKSELKEMIKAAFLSEADFTNAQDDDAAPAIAADYDPLAEGEDMEEDLDEMLARLSEEEVINEQEEEEEEEVDIDVKDTDLSSDDEEVESANDSIVVDKKIVSLSSLPGETRKILDTLETLRAQAEEFGDQKFITQVGNTITFFTRDFVVAGDEPTKAKVDESLEMLRMKKLAGLLTEGEYSKALLRESKKDITKEILSSEEQETINYILGDNIEEVEMGTAQFDTVDNYDYQEVLSRLKKVAKRGLLTIAILSTVFTACDLNSQQQQDVVDTVKTEVQDQQLSQELGWMREAALANSLYSNPRDKKRIDKLAETDFGVKYLITNQNFLNYDKLDAEEKMYIGKDYEDAIKVIRAEFNIPL